MRARINGKKNFAWVTAALGLVLAALGILYYGGIGTKWITLLAGAGILVLLLRGDRKRLWNAPSLLLLGYAAWSWLTIFWAMSGKFHLREGSKILIAVFFFLFVALHKRVDSAFARRVTGVIAGISALYAFMSVEAVTTGAAKTLLRGLPSLDASAIQFTGERLYGIFGNSNMEASVYAVGIFCALALVCGAERKAVRALWAAALFCNAFAFLLAFSMGAMACFGAAVVVYLIFAGGERGAVLVRMLEAAVPALACMLAASGPLGTGSGAALAVMLLGAAVTAALELTLVGSLAAVLGRHHELTVGVLLGVMLCALVYVIAALNVTGPYTMVEGGWLDRMVRLGAGEHTLTVEADGALQYTIETQSRQQIMSGDQGVVSKGTVEGPITFVLPEDTEACRMILSGETGVTVTSAVIDGTRKLPLHYKLLPDFAANRIQRIALSNSQVERAVYREDAIKLFAGSPIVGHGVGAFETGITSVQSFPYETKYVHNHYLQILLEDGVIGFALYAGALVTMLLALWKKRRQMPEGELRWLYPALCAEFVMNGAQMLWDVSMSMIAFLCMTYAVYGLIAGTCAGPIAERAAAVEAGGAKKKKAPVKKRDLSLYVRNAGIGFTAVVMLTLCGNLYAGAKMSAPVSSTDEFMENLRTAARLDLYERNDKMLSYVMTSLDEDSEDSEDHRAQADEYAARLAGVQSNTIPRYLVGYYLQTRQYEKAIDEAILGAAYSASDADTWNNCAELLDQVLFQNILTPLLTGDDRDTLMAKLTDYRDALQAYNAQAVVPLELNEEAQAFFDKIARLNACLEDEALFAVILLTE